MPTKTRLLAREGIKTRYYLVSGVGSSKSTAAYRDAGRLYVLQDATGNDPKLQDVAAFEKYLEREMPSYYAQLEAFRLAAKLGVLGEYAEISQKHPFSKKILALVKLEWCLS